PVLDRGEGGEDAVVAPQVPGGGAEGEPVFDHQAHGQGDDAVGVMAPRGGQVGQVGAEVAVAGLAAVLGGSDVEVPRAGPAPAGDVVEETPAAGVAIATTATARAGAAAVAARAAFDQGPGQVFDTGDPLGAVGDIFSRRHAWLPTTTGRAGKAKQ